VVQKQVEMSAMPVVRVDITANTTGCELIEPDMAPKDLAKSDLNFDFLEVMKDSIIKSRKDRRGRKHPENASDGKQIVRKSINGSDRTIKTQRFLQKHLTVGGLSTVHVAAAKPLAEIEDVSNITFTAESNEIEGVIQEATKKPLTAVSASTTRTKVESLIRDFDQEVYPGNRTASNFESPKSIDLSPEVGKKLSRFVKN